MNYPDAFNQALAITIQHEGSEYTNDPDDGGGPTKFGITLEDLKETNPNATAENVQHLTQDQAAAIYYQKYWLAPSIDKLPAGVLQICLFDQGVLLGPATATKMLQSSIDVETDGVIGPLTLREISHFQDEHLALEFLCYAQDHFIDIVIGKPSQVKYLRGWLARTHDLMGLCV